MRYRLQRHDGTDCSATMVPITVLRMVPIQRYRHKNESYEDFIKRSRLNPIGRQVKLHDLEDNMDITRLNELTEKDICRLNKYLKAYKYLKE